MRTLGIILMYVGFFAAAFVSVRRSDDVQLDSLPAGQKADWQTIEWQWYLPAFAVSLAGVVVIRMTDRALAGHSHKVESDLATIDRSLGNLVTRLAALNRVRDEIGVYQVAPTIDDSLMDDLGAFVDAREAMIPRYGLRGYAEVMTRFAAAERSINRAWSASVDGYIDETQRCLDRAEALMREAHTVLAGLPADDRWTG